jgi:DNA invertase Pin-like site-specific DNA recombinase
MQKNGALPNLPAAIYARISADKAGEAAGVDRQEADCRALAERLGWDVAAVFVDNDVSAYSGVVRPQYRAMLEAVRAGEVRGVIAWHTDRLHRRTSELEELVNIAEAHDLQIQTVSAGTIDLSSASGRMVARMLGAAAQHEVEHAKERIKRAKDQAALDGKYRGGPRPFGFEKDGLTIRESEAKPLREATKALLAGRTLAALAREWNEQGLTGTRGRPWTYNNLRDMLLRPRNAGLLARGLPGRKGRGSAEPDWSFEADVIGKGEWPAIVPEDEWRALVGLLADPSRRTNQSSEPRWLGSGIYRCGRDGCGAPLRTAPHGGTQAKRFTRRYLYRCTAQAHLTVSAAPTDDYVLGVVAELIRDPRVVAAMHPGDGHLAADRERRTMLAARLESFESDYALGRITGAQLQKATAAVSADIAEVDARLVKALRRSSSSAVMRSADPGAAFLAAPIDVQRAVLATVLQVEVVPQVQRGRAWSPDRLKLTPVR